MITSVIALWLVLGLGYYFLAGGSTGLGHQKISEKGAEVFYYEITQPLVASFPRGSKINLIQILFLYRLTMYQPLGTRIQ